MALIICSECGKQYSDKAIACPNCGNPTCSGSPQIQPQSLFDVNNQMNNIMLSQYVEKLSTKEQTSGIIWAVIAVIQVILAISGLWFPLIAAIVNGFASYAAFRQSKKVREPYSGIVRTYEKQLSGIVVLLIYNVIFGGIIGVVGNIFDLNTRNYVLTNRAVFESLVENKEKKAEVEAQATGKVRLTVQYTKKRGGAACGVYTLDTHPEKHVVMDNEPVNHYINPGMHTITFKLNFKEYPFQFKVENNKTMTFLGSSTNIQLNNANT